MSAYEHHMADAPFLVKGTSIQDRDIKMSALLDHPVYLETDYSRFDMSISSEVIAQIEMSLLSLAYSPTEFPYFWAHYLMTLHTVGVSAIGTYYQSIGGRCSGDAHTSIGNGIINAFNSFLISLSPKNTALYFNEGDDGLLGTTCEHMDEVISNMTVLPMLGFSLKYDVYSEIEMTSFCGRFLYNDLGRLRSYSDPYRTLSKFHTACSNMLPYNVARAKALSVIHMNYQTPILTQLALLFIRSTHGGHFSDLRHLQNYYAAEKAGNPFNFLPNLSNCDEPSPQIRAAFALRTGISPPHQIRYENYLRSFDVVPSKFVALFNDLDIEAPSSALYGAVLDCMTA